MDFSPWLSIGWGHGYKIGIKWKHVNNWLKLSTQTCVHLVPLTYFGMHIVLDGVNRFATDTADTEFWESFLKWQAVIF